VPMTSPHFVASYQGIALAIPQVAQNRTPL
jgi:hypothetical protein